MLSIVLPTFNESRSGYLPAILQALSKVSDAEVLVVDGGSGDDTVQQVREYSFQVLELADCTRAARLKRGMEVARGEVIFLHHPRSLVGPAAFNLLMEFFANHEPAWGGLSHRFDAEHWLLRFTSWYSNRIRFDWRGIVYLDHCVFLHRAFLPEALKMPDLPIFEDTELSLLLRKKSSPIRMEQIATTSAIRFNQNGVIRQSLQNQLLKIGYHLGVSSKLMNDFYEKSLGLNK